MSGLLDRFERIARSVGAEQMAEPTATPAPSGTTERDEPHPFEGRNIHRDLPAKVRKLALMMDAFNEDSAKIKLNALITESEVDEQKGFKFIIAGATTGIRNPRGHEVDIGDTPDEALDYMGLASLLLRRLDAIGLR